MLNSQNDCSLSFWWSKIGHNVLTVTAQVNFYVNAFLTYSNPTQLKLHTTPVDSPIPSLVSRKKHTINICRQTAYQWPLSYRYQLKFHCEKCVVKFQYECTLALVRHHISCWITRPWSHYRNSTYKRKFVCAFCEQQNTSKRHNSSVSPLEKAPRPQKFCVPSKHNTLNKCICSCEQPNFHCKCVAIVNVWLLLM